MEELVCPDILNGQISNTKRAKRTLPEEKLQLKSDGKSKDNIKRAIAKGAGEANGAKYEEITYEGYGPAGVAIMLDVLTDNRNRAAADIRHAFSKHGGNMGETGSVGWMFKRKGIFTIDKEAGYDEDEVMMIALDAGAEDMKSMEDSFEIVTQPEDYDAVEKALADNNIETVMSEITMVPDTMVQLSEEDAEKVRKTIDMFDDMDDVQEVYTNADLPDDDDEE